MYMVMLILYRSYFVDEILKTWDSIGIRGRPSWQAPLSGAFGAKICPNTALCRYLD